jgi:hypothetical protein
LRKQTLDDLVKAGASRVLAAREYGNIQQEFNQIFRTACDQYEKEFVRALYNSLRTDPEAYTYARQMVCRARRTKQKV